MAEAQNDSRGQPEGSREPNKRNSAEKVDMHEHFMGKLADEHETGNLDTRNGREPVDRSGTTPPAQEAREPASVPAEQTPGSPNDEGDEGANNQNKPNVEQEFDFPIEYVDDDNKVIGYGDDDGNLFNLDGTPTEPDNKENGSEGGESKEPGSEGEIGALQVDDRQYTSDEIRQLVQKDRERDADYRRKTTVMSRLRSEYEATGQEMDTVGKFFEGLANQNLAQFERIDTSKMDQEQFAAYRDQYGKAQQGATQLSTAMINLRKDFREKRNAHMNHAAAESREILEGIEPRWGNDFYGKIRDYAVKSGRYTAEEFSDVTDHRTMEGLIALMDRDAVHKITSGESGESETKEPANRKRRRQRRRQKRNPQGQFANSKETVLQSSNARKDGSLRDHFMAKLDAERNNT